MAGREGTEERGENVVEEGEGALVAGREGREETGENVEEEGEGAFGTEREGREEEGEVGFSVRGRGEGGKVF